MSAVTPPYHSTARRPGQKEPPGGLYQAVGGQQVGQGDHQQEGGHPSGLYLGQGGLYIGQGGLYLGQGGIYLGQGGLYLDQYGLYLCQYCLYKAVCGQGICQGTHQQEWGHTSHY